MINPGSGSFGSLTAGGRVPQSVTQATPARHHQRHRFRIQLRHGREHARRHRLRGDQLELPLPGFAASVHHQRECAGWRRRARAIGQRPDRRLDFIPAERIRIQHFHDSEWRGERRSEHVVRNSALGSWRRGDHPDRRAARALRRQHTSRWHHPDRECRQYERRNARHGRHRGRGRHSAANLSATGSAALGGRHRAHGEWRWQRCAGTGAEPGLSTVVGHGLPGAQQPGGHDRHRRQQRRQLGRLRHRVRGQQCHRAQQLRHREQLRHSHGRTAAPGRWSR